MEEITLNKFRKETKHKTVKFNFKGRDGSIKYFETNKFYCNPYGSGDFKMLSMPRFGLSRESKFYKTSDTEFLAVSEFGETSFKVIPCN